jgi:hypothetical protein
MAGSVTRFVGRRRWLVAWLTFACVLLSGGISLVSRGCPMEQEPNPTDHRFAARVLTGLILSAVVGVVFSMSISAKLTA